MITFSISYLNINASRGGHVIYWKAELNATIEFKCIKHDYLIHDWELRTEGAAMDDIEALRCCIERLINHQYETTRNFHKPPCECFIDWNEKMNFNFTSLQEPFRSMFEELFKDSTWSIQKKLSEGQKKIPG